MAIKNIKKTKLPKKEHYLMTIPIGGIDYDVVIMDLPRVDNYTLLGLCDFNQRKICIDTSRLASDNEICYVLFHELIHACIDASISKESIKDIQDDDFVLPFSRSIWGAMRAAGLINEWWSKGRGINNRKKRKSRK